MGSPFGRALVACACILSLAPAFGAGTAFAQSDGVEVKGDVTAGDGTPIRDATVTLQTQAVTLTAHTDKHGHFKIKHVAPGTYLVSAAAPGYARVYQRAVTVASEKSRIAFALLPATTNSLTVIGHVQASAGETVSTASAPSVDLSAQSAAATGITAVAPMIWSQLGVTPVIPLGGGSNATVAFAVRGPDPTETLVDIDGHPVNNGNTGDADLSLLDPAALQDVQVIYGISPSSLLGPNQIGGAINIQTLQPTQTSHALIRLFGGSYGSFGETAQATGSDGRIGYAFSVHGAQSDGSVNQTLLAVAPAGTPPSTSNAYSLQTQGSGSYGDSLLGKLRYQLGGQNGYGYLQLDFRGQNVYKDESALLTNYTPPNFASGGGGDDARPRDDGGSPGGFQSFSGTTLAANQFNYGFDGQIPLGNAKIDGVPATFLQFSHLTTLNTQSVDGPGEASQQYLYNQRDALGDDWLEIDRRFRSGDLSFKYDVGTEALDTDYVQGQVVAHVIQVEPPMSALAMPFDASAGPQVESLAQVQRSAVLRYSEDPTSHIHYSLETYFSNFSTFGSSFDPRAGFVWTPTGTSALRASVGTTFQAPQLSELVVPPLGDRVNVGNVVYIGNPNLQPDHATDYDLAGEQIFGKAGRQLRLTADLYQNNVRAQSTQLNPPAYDHKRPCNPNILVGTYACPISYPVNAGNAIYRGFDVTAEQQIGDHFRVRAGWDVDSSYLTNAPANVQDGTLVIGQQTLGQPLHKAYVGFDRESTHGLSFGAQLNYEGFYNELNRSPYATLDAHLAYRSHGYEFGLYGTNLTNADAQPYAIIGGGVPYGTVPGNLPILPVAYTLQGAKVVFVVTRSI
ncbi:MAG: TonB-dependent receptor [Candidatus Eremiobacteraeota bacterium]|nr:TonB-dependent receptor [Candidatus Eremiobacteraeota bacterium]